MKAKTTTGRRRKLAGFNGSRLRLARQLLGKTQRELGELVVLSDTMIAHYETGQRNPRAEIVEALAVVLGVTPEYFFVAENDLFEASQLNFRDHITATERLRRRVIGYANFFAMAVRAVDEEVEFPRLNLPKISEGDRQNIERVAEITRAHLGLSPFAPIGKVGRLLERSGIVLTDLRLLPEEIAKVDALSAYGRTNVVLSNATKESVSRIRWSWSHELAHGILHSDNRFMSLEEKEREANLFAGAFLVPAGAFVGEFHRARSGFDGLLEMKMKWGISVAAILMRARILELLNAAEIRVWYAKLSRCGWRRSEPAEWSAEAEVPELFANAVGKYSTQPLKKLSARLNWTEEKVTEVTGITDIHPAIGERPNRVVSLMDRMVERQAR